MQAHAQRRQGDDAGDDLGERVGHEGRGAGEQLLQDDADRPYVGAHVHVASDAQLLGRHVQGRAHLRRLVRQLALVAGELRDAEVEDLHHRRAVGPARQEHVGRLQIAVHDPGDVGLGQRLERLQHVVDDLLDGQRPVLLERPLEVLPLEVLHHHVGRAARVRGHVEHPGHVLALDLRGGAGLAGEASDGLGMLGARRAAGT